MLHEHAQARAWVTFTCRDGSRTSAGDLVTVCARFLDAEPQVVAIGINCVDPALVTSLVCSTAAGTRKPIVAYPNSGEVWNAEGSCWEGTATRFTAHLGEWISVTPT